MDQQDSKECPPVVGPMWDENDTDFRPLRRPNIKLISTKLWPYPAPPMQEEVSSEEELDWNDAIEELLASFAELSIDNGEKETEVVKEITSKEKEITEEQQLLAEECSEKFIETDKEKLSKETEKTGEQKVRDERCGNGDKEAEMEKEIPNYVLIGTN